MKIKETKGIGFFVRCLTSLCFIFTFIFTSTLALAASPPTSSTTDSSQTTPINPKNMTIYFPGVTTVPPPSNPGAYNTIADCPQKIENCPDINNQNGDPNTCPNYCKVTRNPAVLTFAQGTNRVTNTSQVINAVCPAGYLSIASFNMEQEVYYDPHPADIYPVVTMRSFNDYSVAGYYCRPNSAQLYQSKEYCKGPIFSVGQATDQLTNANPDVAYVMGIRQTSCSCKGSCLPCSCNVISDANFTYSFYFAICTPPPGLYLTGNMVPVSSVCVRNQSSWQH